MNAHKTTIAVLMALVFLLGLMLGRYVWPADGMNGAASTRGTDTTEKAPVAGQQNGANNTSATSTPTTTQTNGTVVNTSSLSSSQKAMLTALGIDAETIVVTPEMIACAEAKVGVARAEEIKNGATPSFSEGVKLVACYK